MHMKSSTFTIQEETNEFLTNEFSFLFWFVDCDDVGMFLLRGKNTLFCFFLTLSDLKIVKYLWDFLSVRQILSQNLCFYCKMYKNLKKKKNNERNWSEGTDVGEGGLAGQTKRSLVLDVATECAGPVGWRGGRGQASTNKTNKKTKVTSIWKIRRT